MTYPSMIYPSMIYPSMIYPSMMIDVSEVVFMLYIEAFLATI